MNSSNLLPRSRSQTAASSSSRIPLRRVSAPTKMNRHGTVSACSAPVGAVRRPLGRGIFTPFGTTSNRARPVKGDSLSRQSCDRTTTASASSHPRRIADRPIHPLS